MIDYCAKCKRCHDDGLRDDEECNYYGEPFGCNHPNRGHTNAEMGIMTNGEKFKSAQERAEEPQGVWGGEVMANNPITVYRIQYAFKPRGYLHDDERFFYSLDEAKESMRCEVANAKAMLEGGLKWACYWRLMKYEMTPIEVVEQTEIKENNNV